MSQSSQQKKQSVPKQNIVLDRLIQQKYLSKPTIPPKLSYRERKKLTTVSSQPEIKKVLDINTDIEESIMIPPINTDIEFSTILPYFIPDENLLKTIAYLPSTFNWKDITNTDTPDIIRKKKLIQKPSNQGACGSCWAFTTCSVISDHFVVSGVVDWMPNLSVTYALTCYPQNQCEGGNPAILINDITEKGIPSDNCIDYSWCETNENCIQIRELISEESLSKLIPSCGCYNNTKHLMFNIDNTTKSIYIDNEKNMDVNKVQLIVKNQIFTKGPVIAGFIIFKNFNNGYFTHVNQGIYFEKGVYDKHNEIKFSDEQTSDENLIGGHAVSIIGWGIAENIIINNNGDTNTVKYWYCRNSWSEKWGDGGYFKIAMYPWNTISQFENLVVIEDINNNLKYLGGMILCSVSKLPKEENFLKSNYTGEKKYNDDYYKLITKCLTRGYPCKELSSNTVHSFKSTYNPILILFIFIIFLIFIIILIIIFIKKE